MRTQSTKLPPKDYREGSAKSKRKRDLEIEIKAGKESEETSDPEGEEEMDASSTSRSRKRSARGAKRTAAPMDAEGGCCNERKGKGKCSACASGKPCSGKSQPMADASCNTKRGDALSAQDYLAACDLGIQDRSRPYIRARLDAMNALTPATVQIRNDKRCGNSNIPDNKKCNAGAGGTLRKVGTAAAIAGGVAAAAYGASRLRQRGTGLRALPSSTMGTRARMGANQVGSRVRSAAGAARSTASGFASRARSAAGNVNVRSARRGMRRAGQGMQSAYNSARFSTRRGGNWTAANSPGNMARRAANSVRSRFPRRRGGALVRMNSDSIWADGFTPAHRVDKKCGNSGIADNKKCNSGGGGAGPRTLTGPNGQFSRRRIAREGWYGSQLGAKPFSTKSYAKRGAAFNGALGAVGGGLIGYAKGGARGAAVGALTGGAALGAAGAASGALTAGINRATSRAAKRSLRRSPAMR